MKWSVLSAIASFVIVGLEVALAFSGSHFEFHMVGAMAWLVLGTADVVEVRRRMRQRRGTVCIVGDPFDTETNPRRREANARKLTEPS